MPKVPPDEMRARLAKVLSEPEPLPLPLAPVLPRRVALKVAKDAGVAKHNHEVFCKLLSDRVKSFGERPALSPPSELSPTLAKAAAAARNLQRAYDKLDETDRKR